MSLNITRLECNGKFQPLSNQLLEGDHNNNNQKVEFKLALGWPGKRVNRAADIRREGANPFSGNYLINPISYFDIQWLRAKMK